MNSSAFSAARLSWQEGGLYSQDYADVYHQRDHALAESEHVFLAGNGLPDRFAEHDEFVIAELGFGTGRNFLNTWRHFHGQHLTYVATELHPIDAQSLAHIHASGPLHEYAQRLLKRWPLCLPGIHAIELTAQVRLILLWGDSLDMLRRLDLEVHAWYLDGFAPRKNPAMWSAEICQEIARLSGPHTRLGSYSVAAEVRQRLSEHGFICTRRPGLGHKRHCLQAFYQGPWRTVRAPAYIDPPRWPQPHRVLILGAGLAGCAVAHALRRSLYRGDIVLIDGRGIAQGGSGNRVGRAVLRARDWQGLPDAWRAHAFLYAERAWRESPWDLRQGWWEAGEAPSWAYAEKPFSAAGRPGFFRHLFGAQLSPLQLCQHWSRDIELKIMQVSSITGLAQGCYQLQDATGYSIQGDALILAGGAYLEPRWQPAGLQKVAGQVECLPWSGARDMWGGSSYAIADGEHLLYGASFDRQDSREEPCDLDSQANDAALQRLHITAGPLHLPAQRQRRRSLRLMSPDHLPLLGACPDLPQAEQDYADLRHGWRRHHQAPTYAPHFYLNLAHGSHGLSQVELAADHIVAQLLAQTSPLQLPHLRQIHPLRLLLRQLKRGP